MFNNKRINLDENVDFFIRKDSTLPILEIELEAISKKYNITPEMWENSVVTFSMIDSETNVFKIANKTGELFSENKTVSYDGSKRYYLQYKFSEKDTKKEGLYFGEFKIDFFDNEDNICGKLTIPNNKKLQIFVKDSITKTTVV